eukprot:1161585-Pelagomonas_calceolata.AAC.4
MSTVVGRTHGHFWGAKARRVAWQHRETNTLASLVTYWTKWLEGMSFLISMPCKLGLIPRLQKNNQFCNHTFTTHPGKIFSTFASNNAGAFATICLKGV